MNVCPWTYVRTYVFIKWHYAYCKSTFSERGKPLYNSKNDPEIQSVHYKEVPLYKLRHICIQTWADCSSYMQTYHLMPLYEYLFDSIWICRASSRVGERTSTVGPPRSARGLLWYDHTGEITFHYSPLHQYCHWRANTNFNDTIILNFHKKWQPHSW